MVDLVHLKHQRDDDVMIDKFEVRVSHPTGLGSDMDQVQSSCALYRLEHCKPFHFGCAILANFSSTKVLAKR